MSRPTLDSASSLPLSHTRLSRSLAGLSRTFLLADLNRLCSPNPGKQALRFGLFRVRSPLLTESHVVFSSSPYLDVSVQAVPHHSLCIGLWLIRVFRIGFPHSEIHGSKVMCTSPWLFAAYHVFHRLLVPRHPPCALFCLTSLQAVFMKIYDTSEARFRKCL